MEGFRVRTSDAIFSPSSRLCADTSILHLGLPRVDFVLHDLTYVVHLARTRNQITDLRLPCGFALLALLPIAKLARRRGSVCCGRQIEVISSLTAILVDEI